MTARPSLSAMAPARSMARLKIRLMVGLMFAAPALRVSAEDAPTSLGRIEIRLAFSRSMFADVNENDARAAVKVYAQSIGDQNGVFVDSKPALLEGTNAIAEVLKNKQAELLVLTTTEFLALEAQGLEGPLLLSRVKESSAEDYLLLSRQDGPLGTVEDLTGRRLVISGDVRSSLARSWLEVLCREHGLGPADQALAQVTTASKATLVVLPVFFGKADACIVTRNSWEVMCELNPQLKRQLRIVAAAPPVVPALTCFRTGLTATAKQQIIQAVESSASRPAFEQLLVLFKSDSIGNEPLSVLAGTRELVTRYNHLCSDVIPAAALTRSGAPGGGK